MLREYQQRTIDQLYQWFAAGNEGHPCLELPTGSGKSHIVAALCKDALTNWPETRILMLTHVRELIEQNAEKMRLHWPDAPLGIYSAGMGRRDIGEPITFAGIQSVRKRARQIGHIDLIMVDECFTGDTLVSTPSGQKRIDQVRCGDILYNLAGCGEVESISHRQADEVYEVKLNDGTKIKCTGNHKFFTGNGWVEARSLEDGTHLFGIEDVSLLWKRIHTLDTRRREWKSKVCNAGISLDQAKFLLSRVCEEITPDSFGRSGSKENQQQAEGNKAQAYSTWRKRAIASFAASGAFARSWVGMGGRAFCPHEAGAQKRGLSKSLQDRHSQQGNDDSDRDRWGEPQNIGETGTGSAEIGTTGALGVASVSRVKSKGSRSVFNLQVSGHPSYFAGGVAVHNCHLISHRDEGGYRKLIDDLTLINPALRVVGLTATPYRLGHGYITDDGALFSHIIAPVSIEELIFKGFLAPLRSKLTNHKLSVEGVHKRGGEYIESELQAAVNTDDHNVATVDEVIGLAGDRRSWLFFCAGVKHAQNVADILAARGITSACIVGETPKAERERIIKGFKSGEIQALTNANVLTTGFDHPDLDLIAMLRPTMSTGLYVQMAGRGMRPKSHTDHCLVLDFAGVVEMHGPITAVNPKKAGKGTGEAPVKACEQCFELNHISAKECVVCGEPFPVPKPPKATLHDDDIMGMDTTEMGVTEWQWRQHISRASGKAMLAVTYYGALSDRPITEYLTVSHDGYAGQKARVVLAKIVQQSEAGDVMQSETLDDVAFFLNKANFPALIKFKKDGKFHRVMDRRW